MDTMSGITGGVDTHLDVHVVAALNEIGGLLGTRSFPTTPVGYQQLLRWLRGFGELVQVGVEGTGSYGAGLARFLAEHGVVVIEVDRPNRIKRRQRGKSDALDAINAARAALSGEASAAPKTRTGNVEQIRVLRIVRNSATTERTQTLNQMRSLVSTAPAQLRERLRGLSITQLVRTCASLRPGDVTDPTTATKLALRTLARRVQYLDAELAEINATLTPIVTRSAPKLIARHGVGVDTAAPLLIAAGDNNRRIKGEAAYARILGAAPIPAGSGKTDGHHRLHRGGDRQGNAALWRIVLVRMSNDPRTRAYVERRTKEGLSKKEIMRCLKRYVARELYACLPNELTG
jgi:transposase